MDGKPRLSSPNAIPGPAEGVKPIRTAQPGHPGIKSMSVPVMAQKRLVDRTKNQHSFDGRPPDEGPGSQVLVADQETKYPHTMIAWGRTKKSCPIGKHAKVEKFLARLVARFGPGVARTRWTSMPRASTHRNPARYRLGADAEAAVGQAGIPTAPISAMRSRKVQGNHLSGWAFTSSWFRWRATR